MSACSHPKRFLSLRPKQPIPQPRQQSKRNLEVPKKQKHEYYPWPFWFKYFGLRVIPPLNLRSKLEYSRFLYRRSAMMSRLVLSLLALVPVMALRRQARSARSNTTSSEAWPVRIPPYSSYCDGADCKLFPWTCYQKSYEKYCNIMRSVPCIGRRARCQPKGMGRILCDKCPGRDLSRKELWHKMCDGKCAGGEYCYHEGYTVINGQVSDKVHRWWSFSGPMCAPCELVYRRNPATSFMCSVCKGQEQEPGCLSREES